MNRQRRTRLHIRASQLFLLLAGLSGLARALAGTVAPASSSEVIFTDCGADPTGRFNCAVAAREAVLRCQALEHPVLKFPPGRYRFDAPALEHLGIFDFAGLRDLTVDGQGSTLLFAGRAHPFQFTHCAGLKVENLAIDWAEPPFSQGRVIAASDWSFELEIDAGYAVPQRIADVYALMDYDPLTRKPIGNLDIFAPVLESLEQTGSRTVRIVLRRPPNPAKARFIRDTIRRLPGDLVVLRHSLVFGDQALSLERCAQVLVDEVTVYTDPGMALTADRVQDLRVHRLHVLPKPGTDRLMSTVLDAIHCAFMTGSVQVDDCVLAGMGDDGVNIYAKYYAVRGIEGRNRLRMATISPGVPGPAPEPGDRLEFCRPSDLVPYAQAVVRRADWNPGAGLFAVELEGSVPAALAKGDILTNLKFAASLVVSRSLIADNRGRGILISTRDVRVEHCTIRGCTYEGILLLGDPRRQAMSPAQVILRDNVIGDCGAAGIYVPRAGSRIRPGAIVNVTIEDNVIHGFTSSNPGIATRVRTLYPRMLSASTAICLAGVNGMTIRNNSVDGYPVAVSLIGCGEVTVRENRWPSAAGLLTDETTAATARFDPKDHWTQSTGDDGYDRNSYYLASWR